MKRQEENESGKILSFPQKKSKSITIFFILFCGVLLYGVIVMINYLRTTHTVRYQVVEGSLASSTIYRAIAVRDEKIISNPTAGYVNFIAREGQRVAVGDLVYLVDESGNLSDYIEAQSLGENTLTDKELADFRTDIINFVHSYDNTDFDSVYDFKYSLKNTVSKLANTKLLNNMDGATNGSSLTFKYIYSGNTGIVAYWYDGYEQLKFDDINKDCFNEKDYNKTQLLSNELRGIDEQIYKLSLDDDWSIVFPVDEAFAEELLEEDYVLVKFLKNQDESWGKVNILHNADGIYAQLTFTNSMISFVDERYLDVELLLKNESGLKIPSSAIAEKEFFLIDSNYVTEDENGDYGVAMQVYNEDGSKSVSVVKLEVYYYDANIGAYYVDESVLSAGDLLFGTDQTTFVVKERGTLIGVYNINKGYADFKQITILYQNEEYAIVKSNTTYGLRVYDYIALDADTVDDDQFISKSN
ncbi:MAG: hypothetical protein MJ130_02220 [Lachnospiraceae bacterium]|nr:hypothetical protein [Lachnospiraceae bacterium]